MNSYELSKAQKELDQIRKEKALETIYEIIELYTDGHESLRQLLETECDR